jgi:acetyl-CoA carboxylase biotin carboxylase subunit
MQEAGISCVPGSNGPIGDKDRETLHLARQIGYPVIIKKAANGCGGRGMCVVNSDAALLTTIDLTRVEANTAFGNAIVYMEKYLEHPRRDTGTS